MYCVATIQEIQRISCVAPASLFHCATKDIMVEGYKIKKGQRMLANLTKYMNDPEVFPLPQKFMPDRFIHNDNNKSSGNNRRLKVSVNVIEATVSNDILDNRV